MDNPYGENLFNLFPADSQAAAFLAGAKFWEFYSTKATMWPSDQHIVAAEALRRYPLPDDDSTD